MKGSTVTGLFDSVRFRGIELRNRIGISPMCQYSAEDGFTSRWHPVHLGSRAVGGAGMVIVEASAVVPEGRISPQDLGIWKDEHIDGLRELADAIRANGSVPAIQIAHAGRKASTHRPWDGGKPMKADEDGFWTVVGPSPIAFSDAHQVPHELTIDEIRATVVAFGAAARRAREAGFDIVEIHGAHGYLISSFLSPTSNQRTDQYGGSLDNRSRLLMETFAAVRAEWPDDKPVFIRISCSEWIDGGWTIEDSVVLAGLLKDAGVDLIDCSSGGNNQHQQVPTTPGYQVPFADAVRNQAGIPTAAVGLITEPRHADEIIAQGQADLVLIGRESLRSPYWPLTAAKALGVMDRLGIPDQYLRAW